MATAERFTFKTTDGLLLSGVHFTNPGSTKTIVILTGRSEPWLKYGEVFYDLYQKGYSIYSYDHRGQGLSPHLSSVNPEIGHVEYAHSYIEDMNTFMMDVVLPSRKANEDLFLLAHSMGGAIAAGYLSEFDVPFKKAVLNCPMLAINTAPYKEFIARTIVTSATLIGLGEHYGSGQSDYNLNEPFSQNTTTSSPNRWAMENEVYRENPSTIMGGASNRWIMEDITLSHTVRNEMSNVTIPFLMFQAQNDQIVKPNGEEIGCTNAGKLCTLIVMPDSQHEVLQERDEIRDLAFSKILDFLQ
jgi:lysophospholipase